MSWVETADKYMQDNYGLSLADAGFTPDEFEQKFGGMPATDAVVCFALKYDLDPIWC